MKRAEVVGALQPPKGLRSAVPIEGLILARKRGPPVRGQKGRKSGRVGTQKCREAEKNMHRAGSWQI